MIFKISLWSHFRSESLKFLLEIFGVLPFSVYLPWTGTTLSALETLFFILKNFPFVVYSSWSLEHSGLVELGWQQAPALDFVYVTSCVHRALFHRLFQLMWGNCDNVYVQIYLM